MDKRSLKLVGVKRVFRYHGLPVGRMTGQTCLKSSTKGPFFLQKTLNFMSGTEVFMDLRRLSSANGAPVCDESCDMNKMFITLVFVGV